jgi:tyrosyl-tRNA synthetase
MTMDGKALLDELFARGLLQDCTDREGLAARLNTPVVFYCGFDPTGPSLHAGTLVGLSLITRLVNAGHKAIGVLGGATGMVGDPSGRDSERKLLDDQVRIDNLRSIGEQVNRFVPAATLVNNEAWTRMGVMEFLRDVGKHITVNYMLGKESVRARLEDREQGISYTEFSYMLLQAWDFAHLAQAHGCQLQTGGSDQWGNITCGIELARKMGVDQPLWGAVTPLLMTASGKKFGKSEAGTSLWLDPAVTSPYQFYQYWINADDADVERYLKFFTFLALDEIAALMAAHDADRGRRTAQRELAARATAWVHGEAAAADAQAASQAMFGGDFASVQGGALELVLRELPSSTMSRDELGLGIVDALVAKGLADSRGAARRLVQQGGVSVSGRKVEDDKRTLSADDITSNGLVVLKAGKKNFHLIRIA